MILRYWLVYFGKIKSHRNTWIRMIEQPGWPAKLILYPCAPVADGSAVIDCLWHCRKAPAVAVGMLDISFGCFPGIELGILGVEMRMPVDDLELIGGDYIHFLGRRNIGKAHSLGIPLQGFVQTLPQVTHY